MIWQDEINEHLANLHPHEIIVGIIKPAIKQVIDDYVDALRLADSKEQKQLHKNLIVFWNGISRQIKLAR